MCCGSKMCMLCTCVIVVVIVIGFLFGFGVFKDGFHKIKDTIHDSDPVAGAGLGRRGFSGIAAPPSPRGGPF